MSELAILEGAVLHRRQQVLKPLVLARIKLVPEDHRRITGQNLIAHLMICPNQLLRPLELRQIKFQHRILFPEDTGGNLLQAEGLA